MDINKTIKENPCMKCKDYVKCNSEDRKNRVRSLIDNKRDCYTPRTTYGGK